MKTTGVDQVLAQIRSIKGQNVKPLNTAQPIQQPLQTQPGKAVDFSDVLKSSVNKVNETQQASSALQESFLMGDKDTSIAEVMVAMQKASVSFQAATQVRNKVVDAYREIMRMSV